MKRLRILITGARAPVALELARHSQRAGHTTFLADSVRYPVAKASRGIAQYCRLPSPRTGLHAYGDALESLVRSHHIDLVIPTCEEVFYMAWHRERLQQYCQVFCDHFATLRAVHSKWTILEWARKCGISLPESRRLTSVADLRAIADEAHTLVFKPEFSRFASQTLVSPSRNDLGHIRPTAHAPWIAQRRIVGKEYCSYSLAVHGRLHAHSCYHPAYRVGPGAGVYFEPLNHPGIRQFVSAFVHQHHFHGQIGFDFMETPTGSVYLLECNPRGTSGAHLFAQTENLIQAIVSPDHPLLEVSLHPKMVAPALLAWNLIDALRQRRISGLVHDFRRASDVTYTPQDRLPAFYQFVGLAEIFWKSLRDGMSPTEAATADIEWNGEALGEQPDARHATGCEGTSTTGPVCGE